MAHVYALARELADPVARGTLPHTHALAALLAGTVQAEREGRLAPYKAADVYRLQKHLFGLELERRQRRRDIAAMNVRRRVWPLMKLGRPRNVLLAEAHDVNGAAKFPLDEPEVTEIVELIGVARHV